MSNIVLQPNASGTGSITITTPNTNTDRTLNIPDVAGNIVTTGDTGTVTAGMLGSTLDLSSKTLTMPTSANPNAVYLETISFGASAVSSFSFSVTDYDVYEVYVINNTASSASAHLYLAASYDNGSSYPSVWSYRSRIFSMASSTNSDNNGSSAAYGWVWNDQWNGTASGTSGLIRISGVTDGTTNRRLTYSAYMVGQNQSGQQIQIQGGSANSDQLWNRVKLGLTAGTWYGSTKFVICGVKT